MINSHNQIVCDVKKIILNDGVTIMPGYIEAKTSGKFFVHYSEDPNNNLPYRKRVGKTHKQINVGVLRNRLKNDKGKDVVKTMEGTDDRLKKIKKTMHFVNMGVMQKYLA